MVGAMPETDLVDVASRHLALVAVDGAASTVADTLAPGFRLHVDGLTTDGGGYLALIAARWAVEGPRPPLDVMATAPYASVVTLSIEPHCMIHIAVEDELITEMWITSDWRRWMAWLDDGLMS